MSVKLEIERRWLLKRIPEDCLPKYIILQCYGTDEDGRRYRVRKQTKLMTKEVQYFLTYKTPISPGTVYEDESQIDGPAFDEKFRKSDGFISKVRHISKVDDLKFEVDFFSRIHLVILEIELPSIDFEFQMPKEFQNVIIKEITGDNIFSNSKLADPIEQYNQSR